MHKRRNSKRRFQKRIGKRRERKGSLHHHGFRLDDVPDSQIQSESAEKPRANS